MTNVNPPKNVRVILAILLSEMPYLPHTNEDVNAMTKFLGCGVEELFNDIPSAARLARPLDLPQPFDELSLIEFITHLANINKIYKSFIGAGVYERFIPAAVKDLLKRGEFFTAYTPYQPEASQGTLKVIFEFQSFLSDIFAMDVTNASLYDGAHATAEALSLAAASTNNKTFVSSLTLHPHIRQVLKTWGRGLEWNIIDIPYNKESGQIDIDRLIDILKTHNPSAVITSQPNFFGVVEDLEAIRNVLKEYNVIWIVYADPLSQMILSPPGRYNADIVVGEGMSLGLSPSFGGPGIGIFGAQNKYLRRIPGRLVGKTVDADGNTGYTLTLQTREQHIRRDKATSNICSNQSLCALQIALYISAMGPAGLVEAATNSLQGLSRLADGMCEMNGVHKIFYAPFMNDVLISLPCPVELYQKKMIEHGFVSGININRWYPEFKNSILLSSTETKSNHDIDAFIKISHEVINKCRNL